MNTKEALSNCLEVSELIRKAADKAAYNPELSILTATLYALADKLEPIVEPDTAKIIIFPNSNDDEVIF